MKFILVSSFFCAITAGLAASSPIDPRGEIITFDLPSGYGASGTVVMDREKATEYLQDEAGVDIDMLMSYLQTLPAPKENTEYQFLKESGLEGSSVTPHPDEAMSAHDGAVLDSSSEECGKCWLSCAMLSWFPPFFAICMGVCAARGCHP
ncbi:hypothetical protein DL767_001244 [Monosporascus sp. MG133]|nr:hypothetical protein DL767_001244 [Monosporascus sp. MG133]